MSKCQLTDAEAHTLYLSNGWQDPFNNPFPDPDLAKEVRAMLEADTTDEACKIIEYWGCWDSEEHLIDEVTRLRVLAGVDNPSDIVSMLRASGLGLCHRAAAEIERLRIELARKILESGN